MLKIAMCDDDIFILQTVSKLVEAELIEQELDAEITLITDDQQGIYNMVAQDKIDVLFLDIDFKNKGKNGIEFAKDLRELNRSFYIIFLSAYPRYLYLSLVTKVYDYLLKPVNRDVICELVTRLKQDYLKDKNVFLHLSKWKSVSLNSILYIERIGSKSHIITEEKAEVTTKALDTLCKELPSNFKRCYRSCIVNTEKIIMIDKKKKIAILNNKKSCPINSHFNI